MLNKDKFRETRVRKLYREEAYGFSLEEQPFKPPVCVTAAGKSVWGRGDAYRSEGRPFVSVNLVTGGNALFYLDGGCSVVNPGEVMILHTGQSQIIETGPAGRLEKRFILMAGPFVAGIMESTGLAATSIVKATAPAAVRRLLDDAFNECRK